MPKSSRTIEVQTEFTPNPHSLKFNVNCPLLDKGSVYFDSKVAAKASPLAAKFFEIPKIESVLIGQGFVTITRDAALDTWGALIDPVTQVLQEHLAEPNAVIVSDSSVLNAGGKPKSEVEKKIMQVLDAYIRPAIARDGGDIIFHGFKEGVVTLHLQGACSTCPSSMATLKAGVERMLCEYVSEVKEVVQLG